MSLRMNDEEVRRRVVMGNAPEALEELRTRVRYQILRKLPNPTGVCAHGMRVYSDQAGAYSSGYICHLDSHTTCSGGYGADVVWDVQPDRERLLALLDTVRSAR